MKRSNILIVVLLLAVGVVWYLLLANGTSQSSSQNAAGPTTTEFLGHSVTVPAGWSVNTFGTRNGTLNLTKSETGGLAPTLTLEDQRNHAEDPSRFVQGWIASMQLPGSTAKSIEAFHDDATDSANAHCVSMHFAGTQHPFRIICVASNGRWRVTLSGNDGDTPGLDTLVSQLPGFVRGL